MTKIYRNVLIIKRGWKGWEIQLPTYLNIYHRTFKDACKALDDELRILGQ